MFLEPYFNSCPDEEWVVQCYGYPKWSHLACGKGLNTYFCHILSQTLFGNPKGPGELGNPNTCTETKLCLNFILLQLKK